MKLLYHGDCQDLLDRLETPVPVIFMDPPDNLGLAYDQYKDKRDDYYDWLELLIRKSLRVANTVWISYFYAHDLEITYRVRNLLKFERPSVQWRKILWHYTFGQYNDADCGSCYRVQLRLTKPVAKIRGDNIRVPSRRMELGDARACGPRVPGDVWEFPRVVGNAKERRPWHPTQHNEDLMRRIIQFTTDPGDVFIDLFGGTGTSFRTAEGIGRHSLISEISDNYCQKISEEHRDAVVLKDPTDCVKLLSDLQIR